MNIKHSKCAVFTDPFQLIKFICKPMVKLFDLEHQHSTFNIGCILHSFIGPAVLT